MYLVSLASHNLGPDAMLGTKKMLRMIHQSISSHLGRDLAYYEATRSLGIFGVMYKFFFNPRQ